MKVLPIVLIVWGAVVACSLGLAAYIAAETRNERDEQFSNIAKEVKRRTRTIAW